MQISGVGRIGLSQQFETQHNIPSKVLYVQGGWLSSFVFKVTSTRFELKDDFSSLDVAFVPRLSWSASAPPCFQLFSNNHSTEEVTKVKTTNSLLRSATLPRIHVSAQEGGWDISPWSKWTSLRKFSCRMVNCHGTT